MICTTSVWRPVLAALSIFVACLSVSAVPVDPDPDNKLEEIIVSDFRQSTRSELPSSIAVLDARTIAETAVQHFQELAQMVPNLNWAGGVSRPRYFQIRGIGERSQYEGAPNASVGFVIDDLDFSGYGSMATLFDVEQVEVLRGPQGTRYGANALAGLIYVKNRAPSDQFDVLIKAGAGNDDTWSLGAAIGGPINERLSYRAVLHQFNSNGFRRNAYLMSDDTNGRDELSTRFKLRFQPGDNWIFDATLMHVNIDNSYDAFAIDNGFTTYSDRPGQDAQRTSGALLAAVGNLSDAVTLHSISGIARSDVVFSFDADWGNTDFWAPVIYDFFSHTLRDRQSLSQEFRLVSAPGSGLFGDRVDWVAGAIISNNKESNITTDDGNYEGFLLASSITREFEATHTAVFGEVNVALSDDVTLKAGLRVERRDASYQDTAGDRFDPKENSVGGQLALTYALNDRSNVYAKVARGYKAGGFNLGLPAQADNNTLFFDAEFLWNYELGIKGRYFDERLSVDANLFWMQRRDQQVQTSAQLDPANPASFVFFTDNAGKGSNRGAEISADYRASEAATIYASVGLLDTDIKNFDDSTGREGRDQAHAPGYSFALGGRVDFAGHWFARVDLSGKDKFYFSDAHDQISRPYTLTNARFGIEHDNWSLTAWGRNLLDKKYAVRGFFFGNEPARNFVDTLYTRQGDPRTFGLSYEYRYAN